MVIIYGLTHSDMHTLRLTRRQAYISKRKHTHTYIHKCIYIYIYIYIYACIDVSKVNDTFKTVDRLNVN